MSKDNRMQDIIWELLSNGVLVARVSKTLPTISYDTGNVHVDRVRLP
jgi:hypothetical protein